MKKSLCYDEGGKGILIMLNGNSFPEFLTNLQGKCLRTKLESINTSIVLLKDLPGYHTDLIWREEKDFSFDSNRDGRCYFFYTDGIRMLTSLKVNDLSHTWRVTVYKVNRLFLGDVEKEQTCQDTYSTGDDDEAATREMGEGTQRCHKKSCTRADVECVLTVLILTWLLAFLFFFL